jgi:hypothetical protein
MLSLCFDGIKPIYSNLLLLAVIPSSVLAELKVAEKPAWHSVGLIHIS